MSRPAGRLIALLAITGWMLAATATAAQAHASLERSDPADGALLETSPEEVVIRYTEPPDPELSTIDVLDAQGASVASGPARPVPGDRLAMRVSLPTLPDAVYTVAWSATSTADSHTTARAFAFGVGVSPAGATLPADVQARTPPTSALAVAGRLILYVGLVVLLAATTMQFLVFRAPPTGASVALPAAWAMAAGGLAAIIVAAADAANASVAAFLSSQSGDELVRQAIAILVAGAAIVVALRRPTMVAFAVVGATAAAGMLFHAIGGHAGAGTSGRWIKILVAWVHLLAVGVWVGGLLWLLVWLLLGLRGANPKRDAQIRRFSRIAGIALVLAFVTGSLRAADLLGGIGEVGRLFTTAWGVALAWKLVVVTVLVALGAWNRWVNVRRLDDGHAASLRRLVGGEVFLVAGVFGLTGLLAGLPPAEKAEQPGPKTPSEIRVSGSDFATSMRVELVIAPGTPGPNRFVATVEDFDTGEPVDARRVALRVGLPERPDIGGTTVELEPTAGNRWEADDTALSIDGLWEVIVLIETATGATEVPLEVRTRAPPPPEQEVTVTEAASLSLYTFTLPDGNSVQAYLDPAAPGPADVHFTAFDPQGTELPLASATTQAISPAGTKPIDLQRLAPGHFAGELELTEGSWLFMFHAQTEDGQTMIVHYQQRIQEPAE